MTDDTTSYMVVNTKDSMISTLKLRRTPHFHKPDTSKQTIMGLTTAEKNRRKRERKKRERQLRFDEEKEAEAVLEENPAKDVEIEYVAEPLPASFEPLRRFQELTSVSVISDDDKNHDSGLDDHRDLTEESKEEMSKRKLREIYRPTVADLKRRVLRPDLVEAHDITATDPEFLILLKAVPGTVPVPRHWGRKRKYLQGKRGFEKPPFQLPDFIVKTGITEIRDTVAKAESEMSAKQKNRMRVAPKMGAIDVDYRTLYDAFFKHQTKPKNLSKFGDIYYEGKELEVNTSIKPGGPLSKKLREALGMTSETSPVPWLVNMQRYGPPPSYPNLRIPGINAPLPHSDCQYGYHPGGWGKPPVDAYGRPLYGGNPFDPPGSSAISESHDSAGLITSDGKLIIKTAWGALPTGTVEDAAAESEESDMEESEEEEEEEEGEATEETPWEGVESVMPPPLSIPTSTAPVNLRKEAGDETPLSSGQQKQLYQIIEQTKPVVDSKEGAIFSSEHVYSIPGSSTETAVPEGALSVLSKAGTEPVKKKRKQESEDDIELEKNFKF